MLEKVKFAFKNVKQKNIEYAKKIEYNVKRDKVLGLTNSPFRSSIYEILDIVETYKERWNNWIAPWMKESDASKEWENVFLDIYNCNKCPLDSIRRSKSRLKVPGAYTDKQNGVPIMVISEAPGYYEEVTSWRIFDKEFGYPFMGKSGKTFENMLKVINLKRFEMFVTNILKCSDKTEEVKEELADSNSCYLECSNFIYKQIDLFKPVIIWTLGAISHSFIEKYLLYYKEQEPNKRTITYADKKGVTFTSNTILINSAHPAYILRKEEDYWFILKEKITIELIKLMINTLTKESSNGN
jgi:uracil-DNA glycosylase family 4